MIPNKDLTTRYYYRNTLNRCKKYFELEEQAMQNKQEAKRKKKQEEEEKKQKEESDARMKSQ